MATGRLFAWGVSAIAIAVVCILMFYPRRYSTIKQNDSAAIGRIRFIGERQTAYAAQHTERGFACAMSDLSAKDVYSGYRFELQCGRDENGTATSYQIVAQPLRRGETGLHTYCSTQQRLLWYDDSDSPNECFQHRDALK